MRHLLICAGLMIGGAFGIVLSMPLVSQSMEVQAQQDRRTHVVQSGETLFRISRIYDVSVDDLRQWNSLSGNQINVGQRLIVSPPPGTQEQRPEVTAAPRSGELVRHRVSSGETLFSISRRYGVTVNDIKDWNNLDSNLIEVGQILEIRESVQDVTEQPVVVAPPAPPSPPASELRPAPSSADTAAVRVGTTEEEIAAIIPEAPSVPPGEVIRSERTGSAYYVVRQGDTISGIARDHGISTSDLMALNNLRSDRLSTGQVLLVRRPQGLPSVEEATGVSGAQGRFSTHIVRRGERLNDILNRFEMTERELAAMNPDLDVTSLREGQRVAVLIPPDIVYANPYRVQAEQRAEETVDEVRIMRYADTDRGRATTSGDLYNPSGFTAAHNRLPLGTIVFVQNPGNGSGIFVQINDRMVEPGLKLSHAAFEQLGFQQGSSNFASITASER